MKCKRLRRLRAGDVYPKSMSMLTPISCGNAAKAINGRRFRIASNEDLGVRFAPRIVKVPDTDMYEVFSVKLKQLAG